MSTARESVNLPNALTVGRIVLVPVFVWALFAEGGHDPTWRWVAAGVFALAAVTDRLDGWLARRSGTVTDFGIVADPIADKALTGSAFIGLSMLDQLWWWVTAVVLVREIGITVLRAALLRRRLIPASRGGKLKTVLQAVALAGIVAPLPSPLLEAAYVIMAAAVVVTVVTGVDYLLGAYRESRRGPAEATGPR